MAIRKVLITVTTYPLPSRSYDELVCTAGVLEDGRWIRIYPVPFQFLGFKKYQWIELDLEARDPHQDFRPESYRPKHLDLLDLNVVSFVEAKQNWYERKSLCLQNTYDDMSALISDSNAPRNTSLAAFKPAKIRRMIIEPDDREWKQEWLLQLQQMDMLTQGKGETKETARTPIDKIPYKFKYEFEDVTGRVSKMTIEDWEIGALYRNCLKSAEGDEELALQKVRERYETQFLSRNDITFFLGTTLAHHRKRHSNPFTIIGIFYPLKEPQDSLF
jgi:hypothetical protein